MGKRVKAARSQMQADLAAAQQAAAAPGATEEQKQLASTLSSQWESEQAAHRRAAKKKGLGAALKTIQRSPLDPVGATLYSVSSLGKMYKPGTVKSIKGMRDLLRQHHVVETDPSGRKLEQYQNIQRMQKSDDPNVRAQGHQLAVIESKKARRRGVMGIGIGAAALGGMALGGVGGGTAGAGATGAGEAGAGAGAGAGATTGGLDWATMTGTAAAGGGTEAGIGAGAGAAGAGAGAGTTAGIGAGAAKYAVPAALVLASKMGGGTGGKTKAAEGQLQQISAEQQAIGNQLLTQYQSGTLEPGMKASLDKYTSDAKSAMRQQLASMGLSDSTMAEEEMAKIDQNAVITYQQMRDDMLNQGLASLGYATGPASTLLNVQLQRDQNLSNAWANAANTTMMLMAMS